MQRDDTFTSSEIAEMEKIFLDAGRRSDNEAYQLIATQFNNVTGLPRKAAVQWEQVKIWFETKQALEVDRKHHSSLLVPSEDKPPYLGQNVKTLPTGPTDKEVVDSEFEFEARSAKDGAWFDVATFLEHRVLDSGEAEVRVRFAGFDNVEDEWVNVKRGIRQRSLPLESSECRKVKPGDLVLSFREGRDLAVYFDAHVLEVDRKRHDVRGCRCRFLIQYIHDKAVATVSLSRLCRRPAPQCVHDLV